MGPPAHFTDEENWGWAESQHLTSRQESGLPRESLPFTVVPGDVDTESQGNCVPYTGQHWGQAPAQVSRAVVQLLGLSGVLSVIPLSSRPCVCHKHYRWGQDAE